MSTGGDDVVLTIRLVGETDAAAKKPIKAERADSDDQFRSAKQQEATEKAQGTLQDNTKKAIAQTLATGLAPRGFKTQARQVVTSAFGGGGAGGAGGAGVGPVTGFLRNVGTRGAATAAAAHPVAMAAILGLAAAAVSATAAIVALKKASDEHRKALDAIISTVEGSGAMDALRGVQEARLAAARERRGAEMFETLQGPALRQTQMQIAMEDLKSEVNALRLQALEPFMAPITEAVVGLLGYISDAIAWLRSQAWFYETVKQLVNFMLALNPIAAWVLKKLRERYQREDIEAGTAALHDLLDPTAEANQPFPDAPEDEPSIFNDPRFNR